MMKGELIYTLNNILTDSTDSKGFYDLVHTHYMQNSFPLKQEVRNFAPVIQQLLWNDQINRGEVEE